MLSTSAMSEDALIRLENLKRLKIDAATLSLRVGGRNTYWHDMLAGKKSFGEKVARKIESALDLPRLTLDSPSGTASIRITATGTLTDDSNRAVALTKQAQTAINVESLPVELQVICNAFIKQPDDSRTKVLADILQIITQAHGPPSNQGLPAYSHAATRAG